MRVKLLSEIEDLDRRLRADRDIGSYDLLDYPAVRIKTWIVDHWTAQALAHLVHVKRPRVVLELGTSIGYSGIFLAEALRDNNLGKLYTMELVPSKAQLAGENFALLGLDTWVEQSVGDIKNLLGAWQLPLDLLFIDADKKNYRHYLQLLEPFLAVGTIVVADNTINMADQVQDYLNYVAGSKKYLSWNIPTEHGLLLSVRV